MVFGYIPRTPEELERRRRRLENYQNQPILGSHWGHQAGDMVRQLFGAYGQKRLDRAEERARAEAQQQLTDYQRAAADPDPREGRDLQAMARDVITNPWTSAPTRGFLTAEYAHRQGAPMRDLQMEGIRHGMAHQDRVFEAGREDADFNRRMQQAQLVMNRQKLDAAQSGGSDAQARFLEGRSFGLEGDQLRRYALTGKYDSGGAMDGRQSRVASLVTAGNDAVGRMERLFNDGEGFRPTPLSAITGSGPLSVATGNQTEISDWEGSMNEAVSLLVYLRSGAAANESEVITARIPYEVKPWDTDATVRMKLGRLRRALQRAGIEASRQPPEFWKDGPPAQAGPQAGPQAQSGDDEADAIVSELFP